ncbi:hypothetical protein RPIT_07405 [Tessaracoccus flavus]|uniref:Isochorismatase-like domain-containing protein n=1 Tax=Tessaracoccus flavus TaxID=1610493 RepID=A0A1Q2CEY4_9ACTN|nr:isochorismatase family protein [Tessaracoccus flavus]AQP44657.1 hypothetical protein RPIT_07405 [Tessaracoccus flavus]
MSWSLHSEIERRMDPTWKRVSKDKGSVVAGTDVARWLAERDVDTITIVGYMTNNCDIATAVGADELGLAAEILSDAPVATTQAWATAVTARHALPKSDLGTSATQGRAAFGA